MRIMFEQKKPGRTRQSVQPVEMEIEGRPTTVGTLIEATVRACVAAFNLKAASAPDREHMDADLAHNVLSNETIGNLAETGRVAFGIVYNSKEEDSGEAVAHALQCYEDGLFRMFLNGKALGSTDSAIELNEGDCLTVVRLTLLSGRLW